MGRAEGIGSRRVVAVGATGSGKTVFLLRHFLPRERRVLVVDRTGEWRKLLPNARRVQGYRATVDALRGVTELREWRIVTVLSNADLERLTTEVLLPVPEVERGYAAAVGGMGLALDEVDLVVPNTTGNNTLAGLWRLGRHARLSVYAATQRPSRVSKEVTAMCEWVAVLRLHEVRCLKYVKELLGAECYEWGVGWFRREEFGCLLYNTPTQTAYKIDRAGRQVGVWHAGGDLEAGRPGLRVVR